MKPNIEVFVEGKPIEIQFIPSAYQQNDEIFVTLSDSESYEEKLNDQITLYKDVKTKEIVGMMISYLDKHDG